MLARGVFLSCLVVASLAATPARAQSCQDLVDIALKFVDEESDWAKLANVNDMKGVVDAYLAAEEGRKAEAVGKALAEIAIIASFGGGAEILIRTGKASIAGVEWTVAEAERLQTEAYLCGDVSSGSGIRIESAFDRPGAQAIAPRITCRNYPDWLDTPAKFEAFRAFFQGYYSRQARERGLSQTLLDRQWAVIETTWRVREAERRVSRLQDALTKRLDETAKAACPPPAVPVLGADTSDPARLPEPPVPPGGMLVLVDTVVMPHAVDPSIQVSAAPQKNTLTAYWGEATCVWSVPPKALVTQEVFGFDFSLTAASRNNQRFSQNLVVRSGFANVHGLPNEIVVNLEPGESNSATGHLELGAGDLGYAQDYMTWYLQVGGCGGNVDYLYKFRKP